MYCIVDRINFIHGVIKIYDDMTAYFWRTISSFNKLGVGKDTPNIF